MNSNTTIWLLTDDRPGNNNQARAVASIISGTVSEVRIDYNRLVKLPNNFQFGLMSLTLASRNKLRQLGSEGAPQIVVAAGRRLAPVALWLKKRYGAKLVHLMWPEANAGMFDLIILPYHDQEHLGDNIVRVQGCPSLLNEDQMKTATNYWQKKFIAEPPYAGLLFGGNSRQAEFLEKELAKQFASLRLWCDNNKHNLIGVNSRRTSNEQMRLMSRCFGSPHMITSWHPSHSEPNPYLAILSVANILVVSADSVGMISEALSLGKPLLLLRPSKLSAKLNRFVEELVNKKHALWFSEALTMDDLLKLTPKVMGWKEIVERKLEGLYK